MSHTIHQHSHFFRPFGFGNFGGGGVGGVGQLGNGGSQLAPWQQGGSPFVQGPGGMRPGQLNIRDLLFMVMVQVLEMQQQKLEKALTDLQAAQDNDGGGLGGAGGAGGAGGLGGGGNVGQSQGEGGANLEGLTMAVRREQDRYSQLFNMFKNIYDTLSQTIQTANQWQ